MNIINLKDSNIDLNKIQKISYDKNDKITFETNEFIPITSDCMFKAIFGRKENIKFPCKLLSYLIDMSYEELLANLKFTKNETGKEKKEDSNYRQDLVVTLDDVSINIEMNNNSNEEIRERNISYMMRLREDRKNKKNYNQIIQVNLNNYCYKDDSSIRRDYLLMDNEQNILTNKIVIIDIYLPNIKKKMYNKGIKALSEMERFLLIGLEENKQKALEYVGDDIIMKDLEERISDWTLSDDLRESYDKEWALKDEAKREGVIQGIEQGKSEIIKKLLTSGMTVEEISKITDIPVEEIQQIKE